MTNDRKDNYSYDDVSVGFKLICFVILIACVAVVTFFLFGLIRVSFQSGQGSAGITREISYRIGESLIEGVPSDEQLTIINLFIRHVAHFMLFSFLGYMLGIVLFMINRRSITRMIGLLVDWAICFGLSYFTEYYKQFVEGRHFQLEDVRANMTGSLLGICFFLVSHALFLVIQARRKRDEK